MTINLTDAQKTIVNLDEGPILVKAGPGSGKTRVLIERIKRLLRTQPMTKILALTFSNMAAEQMRSRIQEDEDIEDLTDNVTVGTIHSFCLDVVQSRGYLIGLPENLALFENLDDRKRILADAFQSDTMLFESFKANKNQDRYLANCLAMISDYKRAFISPTDPELTDDNARIYALYNNQLVLQGAIDFDDILYYAYRIFSEIPNVSKLYTTQYKYICVDEAQDLNYAQYAVIHAMCGTQFKNLMLVGDTKQSIYGFNGSDSTLMSERFVSDFNPCIFTLNENFRSAKAIVEFANSLEASSGIPNCFYMGELKYTQYNNEDEEAAAVVAKIEELLANGHSDIEGKLSYESFAVIARNRYLFSKLEALFDKHSIPYSFKKTTTGIESESIIFKAFDLELRLLANPRDILHHRELQSLQHNYNAEYDFSKIHTIVTSIDPDDFDLDESFRELYNLISNEINQDEDRLMAIGDLDIWKQHWLKYATQIPSEQRTLLSFRNHVALGKTQLVDSETGVTLLTAHMSKGLQYEVVFVIGLTDGTFPDYRAVQSGGKELEQEQNNMYVAVTRAKRLCYLSSPLYKLMPWGDMKRQRPSRFVSSLIS